MLCYRVACWKGVTHATTIRRPLLLITAETEDFETHSVLGIYDSLKSAKHFVKVTEPSEIPLGGLFIYARALAVNTLPDVKATPIGQIAYGDTEITWTTH